MLRLTQVNIEMSGRLKKCQFLISSYVICTRPNLYRRCYQWGTLRTIKGTLRCKY